MASPASATSWKRATAVVEPFDGEPILPVSSGAEAME
jgi:hypothetical protein